MQEFTKGYKYTAGVLSAILSIYMLLWVVLLIGGVGLSVIADYSVFMLYWHFVGALMGLPL